MPAEYDCNGASGPSGGGTLSSPPHISLETGKSRSRPFSSDGGVAHTAVSPIVARIESALWLDSHVAKYRRLQSQFNGLSEIQVYLLAVDTFEIVNIVKNFAKWSVTYYYAL